MPRQIQSTPESHAPGSSPLADPEFFAKELESWRGERRLFRNLSLELRRSDILQVRGDNGAGKTTLLRTLCGLCTPERGQLIWRGIPIEQNPQAFRSELHYIGHLDGVKLDLSATENVDFARAMQISPSSYSTREILQRLDLDSFKDAIVRTLSAGQKRRVALSRLLTTTASLWILDEPFTALDKTGEAIMRELLTAHLHTGGMVVFSSHHPVVLGGTPITEFELTP
jgi:heme exporter protein A